MTELKRALIIIPLSIIIIPLLILLAQGLYMWSDSPEEIAGKYLICYEPHFTLGIKTGESTWNCFNSSKEQQLWYYETLCEILSKRLFGFSKMTSEYKRLLEKVK